MSDAIVSRLFLFGFVLAVASVPLQASVITLASFTSNTITEGFESVVSSPNSPQSSGFFAVGAQGTYTFSSSGLQLSSPIPNPQGASNGLGPVVGNFAAGNALFGTNDGLITSALFGTAYFAENDLVNYLEPTWTFALPTPAARIGGYFTGGAFSISVYGSAHNLLETVSFPDVTNWANGFVGLQDSGIAYVTITGRQVVLDNFMFDAGSSVPEPNTGVLALGGGLLAAILAARACRSRQPRDFSE